MTASITPMVQTRSINGEMAYAELTHVPRHRQVEQPAKRPAADPHRLALVEPQALQPRENARQRDIRHHGARGKGAGAIMRAGAERDAFRGVSRDVEMVGIAK